MSIRLNSTQAWELAETVRKAAAAKAAGDWPVVFKTPDGEELYFHRIQEGEKKFIAHLTYKDKSQKSLREKLLEKVNEWCEFTDKDEYVRETGAACNEDMHLFHLAQEIREMLE